jgi:hypothetical protein
VNDVISNFSDALTRASALDANITNKANEIIPGNEYSDLISLSMRQVLSNTELTIGEGSDGRLNASDVMLFLREGDENYK